MSVVGGLVLGVTPADLTERFWAKVSRHPSGCWVWTAAVNSRGYGQWGFRGVSRSVHRLTYEAYVGPVPVGLVIDHLCRNTRCCNPAHLEAVTIGENTRRGEAWGLTGAKTHCVRGHELSGNNLLKTARWRSCRACHNLRRRVTFRGGAS